MFKINDYVVYGSTGVCQIIDISKEKNLSSDGIQYYVLQTVYNNKMIIKTPVNNQKILMRQIITKDDVSSLIADIPKRQAIWINDDKERNQNFKVALKTGKSEELIKIIKMIYLEKEEKFALGKKLTKIDEDIMKIAEKQLFEEFAIVLNISPDEVITYINERI
ncbi:CarD family transcriptional regulator [Clostridium sp.]|uniref:CarD family transcriptional regulator n=1 Tax=Clostridium sp. TaxID=1506 RepID=UPI003D6CE933